MTIPTNGEEYCMVKTFKEEFRMKNIKLDHEEPNLFVSAQVGLRLILLIN